MIMRPFSIRPFLFDRNMGAARGWYLARARLPTATVSSRVCGRVSYDHAIFSVPCLVPYLSASRSCWDATSYVQTLVSNGTPARLLQASALAVSGLFWT